MFEATLWHQLRDLRLLSFCLKLTRIACIIAVIESLWSESLFQWLNQRFNWHTLLLFWASRNFAANTTQFRNPNHSIRAAQSVYWGNLFSFGSRGATLWIWINIMSTLLWYFSDPHPLLFHIASCHNKNTTTQHQQLLPPAFILEFTLVPYWIESICHTNRR